MVERITGLVIAGGRSTRMGGNHKALLPLLGKPMAAWVIERLRPQVDDLLINSNGIAPEWQAFGYPLVADRMGGYAGPLAGLHAAMAETSSPLLACVPCDAPLLPDDLVARLRSALHDAAADVAVVRTPASLQPTFFLCRNGLEKSIEDYLAGGGYALRHWMATLSHIEVAFADEQAFSNVNTPDELQELERLLFSSRR